MPRKVFLLAIVFAWGSVAIASAQGPKIPSAVIDYSPAKSRIYIGSPSIAVLPDGTYVASHDYFGPGSKQNRTGVFCSRDKGKSWQKRTDVIGQWWSTLFWHKDALYIVGVSRRYGDAVIRRSTDGGRTWTEPKDKDSGLLAKGKYHCGPMPMLIHGGRIWRALEAATGRWGTGFQPMVMSAPVDADLLKADNWTFTNSLPWPGIKPYGGWLEGNVVATPDGKLVDILRVHESKSGGKAAVVDISDDGKTVSFDLKTGFIDFPGGCKKFTIRFDPKTKLYWSLANVIPNRYRGHNAERTRNTLGLVCSHDLKKWTIKSIILEHPNVAKSGFQYVDWLFDGDDLIATVRTAYDDGRGGAHNCHDANFFTFVRVEDFRERTMAEPPLSAVPQLADKIAAPMTKCSLETPDFTITGTGFRPAMLKNNARAYGNRRYVWKYVPEKFTGWKFTKTDGGVRADIFVKAKHDGVLYVATATSQAGIDMTGWDDTDLSFYYTDKGKSRMHIFKKAIKTGDQVTVPQGNWSGGVVMWSGGD